VAPVQTRHTLDLHAQNESSLRLFVHALAQGPDHIDLRVAGASTKPVERLVAAYGLGARVREGDPPKPVAEAANTRDRVLEALRLLKTQDAAIRLSGEPSAIGLSLADAVEAMTPGDYGVARLRLPADLDGERVAIITNIPNHYRVPLFNALADRLKSQGASLLVLFLGRTYGRRSWVELPEMTFEHRFLSSVGIRMSRSWHPFIPKDLEKALKGFAPTTIVCAGFSPLVAGRALRVARKTQAAFAIWSGETTTGITGSNRLRMIQRRALLKQTDVAFGYGSRAEAYLSALRPDLPVVHVRNTTQTASNESSRAPSGKPLRLLAVAESRPGKRLDLVIDAAIECRDLDWHLTVVGDGPIRESLEQRAAPIADRVTFAGSVPSSKILDYYAQADAFLFPSEIDVFGLVVVEALGAGLATMVSRDPGVVADLCAHELNSVVVPEQTVEAWTGWLRKVLSDNVFRSGISTAARRTVARRWTIEHSADAFVAGLRAAAGRS
jgi:glycosyltransferase involved in cell wall biosynthesis